MNRSWRQISHVAILFIAGAFLTGCVTDQHARIGVVLGDKIKAGNVTNGDLAPDFSFVSEDEKVDTFSQIRGDVTLVTFPDDPNWPNCQRCYKLAQLISRLTRAQTSITAISIANPIKSCDEAFRMLRACEIKAQIKFIILCDQHGRICDLYGSHARGKFFVIDNDGRIIALGKFKDTASVEEALRSAVYEHEVHCNRLYGPQEIDWFY